MRERIDFQLNGRRISLDIDPLKRLVDVLREDFGLTGTKEGCGEGECGACAVLVNGKLANSCITPVGALQASDVISIEGYRETPRYNVLAAAFQKAGAVQCGFCTPGMIMAAEALLRGNPSPDEREIREAIAGNLCRCSGYSMIVEAIQIAVKEGEGLW